MPNIPVEPARTFTRRIEKREERRLLRVPFDVPPEMETLTVSYAYERRRLSEAGPGRTVAPGADPAQNGPRLHHRTGLDAVIEGFIRARDA